MGDCSLGETGAQDSGKIFHLWKMLVVYSNTIGFQI